MPALYAEILLPRKINGQRDTLTYLLPAELQGQIAAGDLVEIPLKQATVRGLVFELHSRRPAFPTKGIIRKINDYYSLAGWQLELLKEISSGHFTPLYKCLKLFYPPSVFSRKKSKQIPPPSGNETNAPPLHQLTTDQQKALSTILGNRDRKILLHGITSSGKTEIYRRITTDNLNRKLQTLLLVPEISLTPQTVRQLEQQFGNNIAVIHSRLNPLKKLQFLTNIARGLHQIVVGSRSAIFAPFSSLGTIIIDEEHEDSYKQDQAPRYHARDIALAISRLYPGPVQVVLGSATPSVESYYQAGLGNYLLVEMNNRVPQGNGEKSHLPTLQIVDLRQELRKRNFSIFSEILAEKLAENLREKNQSILFLNRRGAASAVICRDCGRIEQCPHCSVALTYHSRLSVENSILPAQRLICHHCGKIFPLPSTCSGCGSHLIKQIGLGTQKVEEELQKLFPQARILRADRDTTGQQDGFKTIYDQFRQGKADVLIGTQMIGKGLHLPGVTLVGVVLADTGLGIPDFRSAEKTFQLLTQVAGRSGREKPGEVIIQTYFPEHYALTSTLAQDFSLFYNREIRHRRENLLPPFCRLVKITVENSDAEKARYTVLQLTRELEKFRGENRSSVTEINCYPALIPKLKNRYRWQILLSGDSPRDFLDNFRLQKSLPDGIKIDVDPLRTT
jgi:primosomal protein N' (replication factor Y)